MVGVIDHIKHVTTYLFDKIKRLQASLKRIKLEAIKRARVATENAKAFAEKALNEVTAVQG